MSSVAAQAARLRQAVSEAVAQLRGAYGYHVRVRIDRVRVDESGVTVEGSYSIETLLSVLEKGRYKLTFDKNLETLLAAEFSPETRAPET